MIEYFIQHSGEIASLFTILITLGGMIFWSHKKLHADILDLRIDVKGAHARIDAMGNRIDAMGHRIDAMGQRIDNLYHVMMEMIKERK